MTGTRAQLARQIAAWREICGSIAARQEHTSQPFRAEMRRARAHLSDLEGQLGDYDRAHPDDDLTETDLTETD